MTTWDTQDLHQQAKDTFQGVMSDYTDGKSILDEIAAIRECLLKMDKLTDVRIASCNDSCWHPPIDTERIKVLVSIELDKRRDELRDKFNRMFGGNK